MRDAMRRFQYALLWFVVAVAVPTVVYALPETAQERRVTLRAVRLPLHRVLPELGKQVDRKLDAERDLREQKVVLLIRDQPADDVLKQIAKTLGARWTIVGEPEARHYRLERTPQIKRWLDLRARAKAAADQHARAHQAEFVRRNIDDHLAHVDDPNWKSGGSFDRDAAAFLKTFPSEALDRLAQFIANGFPVGPGNWDRSMPPPVLIPFNELNPEQRQMVENLAAGYRIDMPPQTLIAITSQNGVSVDIMAFAPSRNGVGYSPLFAKLAFDGSLGSKRLAQLRDEEMARRLARISMPKEALLGAEIGPDGKPVLPVAFSDPEAAQRTVKRKEASPLRWRFLEETADALGLNVIADHYTLSHRLRESAPTAEPLLTKAAEAFGTVFRQEGAFLLARRSTWFDDDPGEIAWPLPEQWIARREKGQILYLEDLALLSALPDIKLNALSEYEDGPVSFKYPIMAVQENVRTRPLLAVWAGLSEGQKRQARTASGLALASLPRAQQEAVLRGAQVFDLRGASQMQLRLQPAPAMPDAPPSVMLQLTALGRDRKTPIVLLSATLPAPTADTAP